MPKIKQSVETSTWDNQGNMISKRANKTLSWGGEPAYIKLYLQDIMYLSDVPKQYAALTACLLRRVSYAGDADGMCVVLVPRIKQAICKELGWQRTSSLDNAIQKLLAGKIIYRLDRGIYKLNPYLFGRGDWQDVARLRLEIKYDEIQGCTFAANVEHDKRKQANKPRQVQSQTQYEQQTLDLAVS